MPFDSQFDTYNNKIKSYLYEMRKILSENKEVIKGNVKFLFQPAEENFGGAQKMIQEGCLENPKVDVVIPLICL